jgi:hypothetical protein
LNGPRSSLSSAAAGCREPDQDRAWRIAGEAWREQGILVINPDEVEKRRGWIAGQEARNLGVKLFGERKGAGK